MATKTDSYRPESSNFSKMRFTVIQFMYMIDEIWDTVSLACWNTCREPYLNPITLTLSWFVIVL